MAFELLYNIHNMLKHNTLTWSGQTKLTRKQDETVRY